MQAKRHFSAFLAKAHDPRQSIIEALDFARGYLAESCLEDRARVKALVVIEELVSNSLRYGGAQRDITLHLQLSDTGDALIVELDDDGPLFDPSSAPLSDRPDPHSGGSSGLKIVRAWAQDLRYVRSANRNLVSLSIR